MNHLVTCIAVCDVVLTRFIYIITYRHMKQTVHREHFTSSQICHNCTNLTEDEPLAFDNVRITIKGLHCSRGLITLLKYVARKHTTGPHYTHKLCLFCGGVR